jgi:cell wall-associated NlpC family hydrolase
MANTVLDPRLNAFRADLAEKRLEGRVQAKRFVEGTPAQVNRGFVPVRRGPASTEPLETEALFGETLRVFETTKGFSWVKLDRDGYVGYVPADNLSREVVKTTHHISALATFLYSAPDIKSPPIMQLPLGARMAVASMDERFARLASGGFVALRHVAEDGRHARDFVDVAERFIGTPYLWGGRTRYGLDCSGLLQTALDAAGIPAPRDTDMQQAGLGNEVLIPSDLEGLDRGDLVFWSGHVGIMTDSMMLLHANAHHMAVAVEPLTFAAERIAKANGDRVVGVRRIERRAQMAG